MLGAPAETLHPTFSGLFAGMTRRATSSSCSTLSQRTPAVKAWASGWAQSRRPTCGTCCPVWRCPGDGRVQQRQGRPRPLTRRRRRYRLHARGLRRRPRTLRRHRRHRRPWVARPPCGARSRPRARWRSSAPRGQPLDRGLRPPDPPRARVVTVRRPAAAPGDGRRSAARTWAYSGATSRRAT